MTTTFLLDVNVLVALVDPLHVQHDTAHEWFAAQGHPAWATCPLTENGLMRVVGHARYPGTSGSPAAVARLLTGLRALPEHVFWPDGISLLDATLIDPTRLLASAQLTDTYLLALACANGGQLASFDKRLVKDAVRGGARGLHLIA